MYRLCRSSLAVLSTLGIIHVGNYVHGKQCLVTIDWMLVRAEKQDVNDFPSAICGRVRNVFIRSWIPTWIYAWLVTDNNFFHTAFSGMKLQGCPCSSLTSRGSSEPSKGCTCPSVASYKLRFIILAKNWKWYFHAYETPKGFPGPPNTIL